MMDYEIRSLAMFIAKSAATCWKCGIETPVICLYCSMGTIEEETAEHFSVSNLVECNELVRSRLHEFPFFRMAHSKTAEMSYFANHCEQCQALQGDFYLHSEPGGAFFPETAEEGARIEFVSIAGTAEVTGDAGFGPLSDAFANRMGLPQGK